MMVLNRNWDELVATWGVWRGLTKWNQQNLSPVDTGYTLDMTYTAEGILRPHIPAESPKVSTARTAVERVSWDTGQRCCGAEDSRV